MRTRLLLLTVCCFFRYGECAENETELEGQKDDGRFLIGCDIAATRIPPHDVPELESKMGKLFCLVFERATHERLGQSVMRMSRALNFSSELCVVDVQENRVLNTHVQLIFTIAYDDVLVDAAVATKEISRLTLSHLSATLGYPIVSLYAINQARYHPTIQWWLILIIIGCSLLICVAGWLAMFIYYNTCGLPLRQYTNYTNGQKIEEPSISHTQPSDKTQTKHLPERESCPKSIPVTLPANDDISTKTILSADQITGGLLEPMPEAPEMEPRPIEYPVPKLDTTRHDVPDPDHRPSPPAVQPETRQIETLKELPLPDKFCPYYAGDRVEAIRLQEPRYQHPQPAMPTEDGVLCFRTGND